MAVGVAARNDVQDFLLGGDLRDSLRDAGVHVADDEIHLVALDQLARFFAHRCRRRWRNPRRAIRPGDRAWPPLALICSTASLAPITSFLRDGGIDPPSADRSWPILTGVSPSALMMKGDVTCSAPAAAAVFQKRAAIDPDAWSYVFTIVEIPPLGVSCCLFGFFITRDDSELSRAEVAPFGRGLQAKPRFICDN